MDKSLNLEGINISEILSDHNPEKIICLAAIPLASESNIFTEDAFSTNTSGTVSLLEVLDVGTEGEEDGGFQSGPSSTIIVPSIQG